MTKAKRKTRGQTIYKTLDRQLKI